MTADNGGSLRGNLTVSIGETVLSSWEAANLDVGDIVLSYREAGYPALILFNNLPIGLGEMVVFDRTFGVRIIAGDFRPEFRVDPGRIDELGEMAPATIGIGNIHVDLRSLKGLGRNSVINLEIPFGTETDATLLYAGCPLAEGKVVVVGESMGLRITRRLIDLTGPKEVRQSGNLADERAASAAKDYDFTKPDRWSLAQIKRMAEIHALFQRNLEASFPSIAGLLAGATDRLFVDQCTMREAREFLVPYGLIPEKAFEHWNRRSGNVGDQSPRALFYESPDCLRPATQGSKSYFQHLFREHGAYDRSLVFVHARVELDDERFQQKLAECLRNGWKRYLDFSMTPCSDDTREDSISENEMVILIVLRERNESKPVLALVYPYLTLEPYMKLLGSP